MDEAPDVVVPAAGAVTYGRSSRPKPCCSEYFVQLMSCHTVRPIVHFIVRTRIKRGGGQILPAHAAYQPQPAKPLAGQLTRTCQLALTVFPAGSCRPHSNQVQQPPGLWAATSTCFRLRHLTASRAAPVFASRRSGSVGRSNDDHRRRATYVP
jgi:hypothetical protein